MDGGGGVSGRDKVLFTESFNSPLPSPCTSPASEVYCYTRSETLPVQVNCAAPRERRSGSHVSKKLLCRVSPVCLSGIWAEAVVEFVSSA